jgi:hypothetical protein
VSCKTREEASAKYRIGMEAWLTKYNVKYSSLSFDKPLAAYYIDDKAMTPEMFIDTKISNLEGGLSGSDIYTDGKLVHKTDKNSLIVHQWYMDVQKYPSIKTPKIERVVSETITMEYIKHDKDFFVNNPFISLGLMQQTLESFKNIPVNEIDFNTYIERIESRVNDSGIELFKTPLKSLKDITLKQSFSHGDFGVMNMLFTEDKELYVIDPIPNVFGCTELDAAKFIASLIINKYDTALLLNSWNSLLTYTSLSFNKFQTLVCCELIRVYKYHPDKKFIMECVEDVLR